MKINSNITAYITNNAYSQSEMRLSNSTGKLSSGYRLNKSGDDPANFAIASKMRAMIKGLDKVKTNTTTGMSVIQTAEAAMQETQSMIQRMNELSIKASNGTMSSSDRQNIQDEVKQLLKEIDRIAETTEFNGMKLLNGTFNDRGYTSNEKITVMDYSEETTAGKYAINLTKGSDGNYTVKKSEVDTTTGKYAGYKDADKLFGTVDPAKMSITTETVNYDDTSVDYVTIKGYNGTELRVKVEDSKALPDILELDLTGKGSMRLQVGTEEGEVISASIPLMTTEAMGLAGLDMTTKEGSYKAIDQVNTALEYVNRARSRMGAYENRLENTDSFLDAYNEDINTSLSRIQDTDMAEEMTEFTNMQILSQAGISMLAQANEAPQQALQLLQ
ncbi:MAG: flagellin FliC3 [Lachnospiraceae bacterium]|nr:flagellin FliC3 [Lachnospiraceae bacterium]